MQHEYPDRVGWWLPAVSTDRERESAVQPSTMHDHLMQPTWLPALVVAREPRSRGQRARPLAVLVTLLMTGVVALEVPAAAAPPGSWRTVDEMELGRVRHTDTLLTDGRVLLVGGIHAAAGLARTPTAEIFDPRSGVFVATGSMSYPRRNHTATRLADGRVLVTGGRSSTTADAATAELFDPTFSSWTVTAAMSAPRFRHTATLLADGRVLVAGGVPGPRASAELYDPAAGVWTPTGSMGEARADHTATLLRDGRVLVAGGVDAVSRSRGSSEVYDPATGQWMPTEPMQQARDVHTATRLKDGDVVVAGGQYGSDEDLVSLASAERYETETGRWVAVADMTADRGAGHTANLMPDGRVLVAGGLHELFSAFEFRELTSSEIYDPHKNTWTTTDDMSVGRYGHTATLLRNQRVLVTGGWTPAQDPTRSAELYRYGR